MEKKQANDGKDKYRKRLTPVKIRDLDEELFREIKKAKNKAIKNAPKSLSNSASLNPQKKKMSELCISFDVAEEITKKEEFRIICFAKPKELIPHLIELGNYGGNIELIFKALTFAQPGDYLRNAPPHALKFSPIGTADSIYGGELNPAWNEMVENFNKKKKEFNKRKRIIMNALRVLLELEPIQLDKFDETYYTRADTLPWVNEKIMEAQETLEPLIERYLDAKAIKDGLLGYTVKWGWTKEDVLKEKAQPVKQKNYHNYAANERIFYLKEELNRIGYTDRKAYVKIAELTNIAFPHVFPKKDPDLIRNRYDSFVKKLSPKVKKLSPK